MKLERYVADVLLPANTAVSAMRRAGIPIDIDRLNAQCRWWDERVRDMEREVEGVAASKGTPIKYSDKHGVDPKRMADFLYRGLGLAPMKQTKTGDSTDAEALAHYASIEHPREGDDPTVFKILKIRSFAGAMAKADAYRTTRRADGACHPRYNWALRTSRLSAEDPPVHQIPEHSDPDVANAIKSFMVPRVSPAPDPKDWNPRKHGSVIRWDIDGAEAAVRAAMLTHRFCSKPDPAWEYLRLGKDIHAHTASLIYGKPESDFRKGQIERDVVAKTTFFAQQFGGGWSTVQGNLWKKGRLWMPDDEVKAAVAAFDGGHPGLVELGEWDKEHAARTGYCEDGYGKRRHVGIPDGVKYLGRDRDGKVKWDCPRGLWGELEHALRVAMNSPTQSMNATDCLWMLALAYHGEYVDLAVPPMWERKGIDFPEAADWQLHGGPGPGGKPFQAWHCNTVHDSAWLDCAPGYLEATVKLVTRRCRAVPFDWRLEADVPYRISVQVGPNFGMLRKWSAVAKEFGYEAVE